jgi:hypothetical protein
VSESPKLGVRRAELVQMMLRASETLPDPELKAALRRRVEEIRTSSAHPAVRRSPHAASRTATSLFTSKARRAGIALAIAVALVIAGLVAVALARSARPIHAQRTTMNPATRPAGDQAQSKAPPAEAAASLQQTIDDLARGRLPTLVAAPRPSPDLSARIPELGKGKKIPKDARESTPQTLHRRAVDRAAVGAFLESAEIYDQLAREHPNEAVYRLAAARLRDKVQQ